MITKTPTPLGVRLIAIYFFLGAALDLVIGFMLVSSRESVIDTFPTYLHDYWRILVPFQIALGIFEVFMARALWKAEKWAIVAVFIVSGFQIIVSSALIIQGNTSSSTAHLILYLVFIGYLLLNKNARNLRQDPQLSGDGN
jgi:hypothetical protein